ncbi:hypothetical protein B7463_g3863, partial [Scytalidium lignicola]
MAACRRIAVLPCAANKRVISAAKFFSVGLMSSSAAATLILFQERRVCFIAVLVFIGASMAFASLYLRPITLLGPYALAVVAVLGIVAFSSARTSLKELVPWMPAIVSLFLFLTVYFGPILKAFISGDNPDEDMTLEEGSYYSLNGEPGSLRSLNNSIVPRNGSFSVANQWLQHDISHMSRSEFSFPDHSPHSSDIDLNEGLASCIVTAQRMASPIRAAFQSGAIPQSPPPFGNPDSHFPDLPLTRSEPESSDQLHLPGTEVAQHSPSSSATSNSTEPLLRSAETEC